MKRHVSAFTILVLAAILPRTGSSAAEEAKPAVHWYRMEIQTGDSTYQCLGSSVLEEKEFSKQASGSEFIVLDNVAYLDSTGKVKGWQEWDPKAHPRLYVNPRYIVFFNPMKADPRKASSSKPAMHKP